MSIKLHCVHFKKYFSNSDLDIEIYTQMHVYTYTVYLYRPYIVDKFTHFFFLNTGTQSYCL